MDNQRQLARDYLQDSSLTNFWTIVNEAKISDEDKQILDLRFVKGYKIQEIAAELYMSVGKVNATIKDAYDKVARLL